MTTCETKERGTALVYDAFSLSDGDRRNASLENMNYYIFLISHNVHFYNSLFKTPTKCTSLSLLLSINYPLRMLHKTETYVGDN
jgi:hypothetical protein